MQNSTYATFYLVRHGQTDWNVAGTLQGQSQSVLNAQGESQAQQLGKLLSPIHFDKVFSSDLFRAKRTAQLIVAERKLAVEETKLLRERSWGTFEGQHKRVLDAHDEVYKTLSHAERFTHKAEKDIESDEEIVTRMITFLRETALAYPQKTMLVVAHGGILNAFLIHIGFFTYDNQVYLPNASYVKIRTDGIDFFVDETYGFDASKGTVRDSLHG